MKKLDFEKVAAAALAAADNLLAEWLPGGKYKGHEYFALNPTRADRSLGSFAININTGAWADYATGDAGGDLISLYAYLFCSGRQRDAFRAVAERLDVGGFVPVTRVEWDGSPKTGAKSLRAVWQPIAPVDEDKLGFLSGSKAFAYRARGKKADRRAVYRDAEGRLLCVVQRFMDDAGGKEDLPFTWCRNGDGVMQWANRRLLDPQPLYGLDALAQRPDAPVLLVEGEKCKDVAAGCADLADYVAMSWLGGCNGWKKADWQPLAGRDVVLWPDCDSQRRKMTKKEAESGCKPEDMPFLPYEEQPGMAAMLGIAEKLAGLGCAVRLVEVAQPGVWPAGYDVADVVQGGQPLVPLPLHVAALLDYPLAAPVPAFPPYPDRSGSAAARPHDMGGGAGDDDYYAAGYDAEESLLDELLENYAQVGLKDKAISLKTGETFSFQQLRKIFGKEVVTTWSYKPARQKLEVFEADILAKRLKLEAMAQKDDIFQSALNRYIYLDGTTDAFDLKLDQVVTLSAAKAAMPEQFEDWQKSAARQTCPISNYVFEPDLPCGVSYGDEGVSYINMFRGLPITAAAPAKPWLPETPLADLKAAYPGCRHIVGLIEHLCSNNGDKSAAVAEWVLNWLACRFRWPERKPATALVFISETQGVGKSTFGERVVKGLFGEYLRQLDQNALESRFNAILLFALVTIFEEISPSDERMNIIGKLKNMITSDVIMVERKGRDAEKHSDYNSFIIFSNDERSIPIESNDRRFMVSSCNRKFTDVQYQALDEELQNGGLTAFAEFLWALPLMHTNDAGVRKAFTPHSKPLMTPIKRRMISLNKPGWEAFIDDWYSGDVKVPFITCAAADLWLVYKSWCAETKTFSMTQKNFYANISKRLQDTRTWVNLNGNKKRLRLFVVPHEWLSDAHKQRYRQPNTDHVQRGTEAAVNQADYYGQQVVDFNNLAGLPPM